MKIIVQTFNDAFKKCILFGLVLITLSNTQVLCQTASICSPVLPDTILCGSSPLRLALNPPPQLKNTTSYSIQNITYAPPVAYSSGTPVPGLTIDDLFSSSWIPLGFNFCFFGNTYNQCLVSSNNYITFDPTKAPSGASPWTIPGPMPSTAGAAPKNCIMAPWVDIDPGIPASVDIRYLTVGTAPCRMFIVIYNDIMMFSCTRLRYNGMIVLYETSNIIETYIEVLPNCPGWNGGRAIHGLHDQTGTVAFIVPGRNATGYTLANDAIRFTPNGPSTAGTVTWGSIPGGVISTGTDTAITVSPPSGTTTRYYATINYTCNAAIVRDTNTVVSSSAFPVSSTISGRNFCARDSNVVLRAIPAGGVAPHRYRWSSGDTTAATRGLPSGSYTVTVTDATGCAITLTIPITSPVPLSITTSSTPQRCFNQASASVSVNASNGTLPYRYSWSTVPVSTTASVSALLPGTYTVTVTDSAGCTATATTTAGAASRISPSILLLSGIRCFNDSNALIRVNNISGRFPLSYFLDGGPALPSNTISGLRAGLHQVRVVDSLGCIDSTSVIITEPSALSIRLDSSKNTPCGLNYGQLAISVSGGRLPYTYRWSSGSVGRIADSLVGGRFYYVTVTDSNACIKTDSFYITNIQTTIVLDSIFNSQCFAFNTGRIYVRAATGIAPIRFSWNRGDTTSALVNASPGIYSVIATDAAGCTATDTFTISEPTQLTLNLDSIVLVSCNGRNDGYVEVSSSGGVLPHSYTWSTGTVSPRLDSLRLGQYTVTLTDSNNCNLLDTFDIAEPGSLIVNVDSFSNVLCHSDSTGYIRILVSGGTSPYSYQWSNGNTTSIASPLIRNTYSYVVRDFNGCEYRDTLLIEENPQITLTALIENNACFNYSDGRIILNTLGGLGFYTYMWNDPRTQTTSIADSLNAGIYTVRIQDSLGCQITDTFTITEPAPLTLQIDSIHNIRCFSENNGSIYLSANGGSGTYLFSIDNGATWNVNSTIDSLIAGIYFVQLRDDSFCLARDTAEIVQPSILSLALDSLANVKCFGELNGALRISISGGTLSYQVVWQNGDTGLFTHSLSSGSYWVTVTDSHLCQISDTFLITQPALFTGITNQTNNLCFGDSSGSASINMVGGTLPYSFQWNDRWGQTTSNAVNLLVGTYIVIATDFNNCSFSDTLTLTQPTQLITTFIKRDVTCHNGSDGEIQVTASGGSMPYRYLLNGILQPSSTFRNLDSNAYLVSIIDQNNCRFDTQIIVSQPPRIGLQVLLIDTVKCFGESTGSFQVIALSPQGVPGYTLDNINYIGTGLFRSLSSSSYRVFVRDAIGCFDSLDLFIPQPSLLVLSNTFQNPRCFQDTNGLINLLASGGILPYRYSINNGSTFSASPSFPNLGQANYFIAVFDRNNCSVRDTVDMVHPSLLELDHTFTPTSCSSSTDGTITYIPSGGTTPYLSYLISSDRVVFDSLKSGFTNGLSKGTYAIGVIDFNGCMAWDSATISSPPVDTFLVLSDSTTCFYHNFSNGALYVLGAVNPPYRYSMDNGVTFQNTGSFYYLKSGLYQIITENRYGCRDTVSGYVFSPGPFSLSINPDSLFLDLVGEGSIDVSVTNALSPTFIWSPQSGLSCSDCAEPIISPHEDQEYTLRVIDHRSILSGEDCYIESKVYVIVERHKRSYLPNAFSPNGDGVNDEWLIYGEGIKSVKMMVYDRWGEKVFESNRVFKGWNGVFNGLILNPGVYAYYVEVEYLDNQKENYQGSVTLIR